ncbi:hypothetical protein [Halococcus hamelinensis]|nr:hypothetical protein [Halococcus hamelinensis]
MQGNNGADRKNGRTRTCQRCGKGMSSPYINDGICYHCRDR